MRLWQGDRELDESVFSYLPSPLSEELIKRSPPKVDEIRLRKGEKCAYTADGKNHPLNVSFYGRELDETLKKLCEGSLYAYADTIKQGYVTVRNGIRVGIGGRAVCENGKILGVYDVSSLCIRIPHGVWDVGSPVCELVEKSGGVLVYSPPGVGKTTFVRSVTAKLAGGYEPLRVAVVDTRGEIACKLPNGLMVDILSGYPKGDGIEIAARTLSPDVIIVDEIGSSDAEINAILSAHNCGVPLVATAHAKTAEELLKRSGIRRLHEAAIFQNYVGIARGVGKDYDYTVTKREDAVLN